MQAVEFDSYVENGVISVPLEYQNTITRSVRVIVFPKQETPVNLQTPVKKKPLFSLAVDMTGFSFNRDEVNER